MDFATFVNLRRLGSDPHVILPILDRMENGDLRWLLESHLAPLNVSDARERELFAAFQRRLQELADHQAQNPLAWADSNTR